MSFAKKVAVVNMNRDPITDAPGSHPVGTGLGSASGATAGAFAGALFGPIGMLVGGTIGAIAGAAAGHSVAEQIDPTGEIEYWRSSYGSRPYFDNQRSFDTDYQPAYLYGVNSRNRLIGRQWDSALENELKNEWLAKRGSSTLIWEAAQPAVRDAWDRTDRAFSTYDASDRYYSARFTDAKYREGNRIFSDYREAYRYGTYARSMHPRREWDAELEAELARGWDLAKGTSKLDWAQAKGAVHDAWDSLEHARTSAVDGVGVRN